MSAAATISTSSIAARYFMCVSAMPPAPMNPMRNLPSDTPTPPLLPEIRAGHRTDVPGAVQSGCRRGLTGDLHHTPPVRADKDQPGCAPGGRGRGRRHDGLAAVQLW